MSPHRSRQHSTHGVVFDLPPGADLELTLQEKREGGSAILADGATQEDSLAALGGESLVFDVTGSFDARGDLPLGIRVPAEADESAAFAIALDDEGDLHFLGLPALREGDHLDLRVDLRRLADPAEKEEREGATLVSPGRVAKLWVKKVLRLPDRSLGLFQVSPGPGVTLQYAPAGSKARVGPHALTLHGALSELRAMEGLSQLLLGDQAPREYAAVLGFDYETVATGIERNGAELAQALCRAGFGEDGSIDVFAYSMGTQVTRSLIELAGASGLVRDVVLVAPPNGGTRLANDQDRALRWGGLVVNAATSTMGPAGALSTVLTGLLRVVERKDDGLDDLKESSAFHQKLNTAGDPGQVRYHTVSGVTSQAPGFLRRALNGAALAYFQDANDWVVPLRSTVSPHDLATQQVDENHFGFFRDRCQPIGWVLDGWLSP